MTENFSAITQKIEEHKSKVTKELKNTQSQLTKDLQEYNESLEKLTKKGTTELQNSLELQEKELLTRLKQQHQKRLKLIDSQLEENWGITESLLKAPIIKISLIVVTLGIIIGVISTIMIRPYLIPSESQEWIVPQEVRYTHEGTKYIMIKKDNPNLYNGNDNQTKYLKIGD